MKKHLKTLIDALTSKISTDVDVCISDDEYDTAIDFLEKRNIPI